MPSKRLQKFAIRRRADAVTKERRRLQRMDRALRNGYRAASDLVRLAEDEPTWRTTARHS